MVVVVCAVMFTTGCKQQAVASSAKPITKAGQTAVQPVTKTEPVRGEPVAAEQIEQTVEPNVVKTAAEPDVKGVAEANDLQPVLKLESTEHNFGEVGVKTQNACSFKFSNAGKVLLVIKNIKSTCGCAVPDLPKKEYAPGESGNIEIRFTAGGEEDHKVVKHLYVQSNDKSNPDAELTLKAKVVTRVKYEPQILKLSLKYPDTNSPTIKLTSVDGNAFAITAVQATADAVTVEFDPNFSATQFVIKPKVNADVLKKVLNGSISFTLNHPQCSQINIFFEAMPVYNLNPPMIMVLKARPGTAIIREIWVLNNYNEPFEIESVSSQKGLVRLISREKQDKGYKLNVEIVPPVSQNKIKIFSDTVEIKIKGGEKLEVNCRGFFEKDAQKAK